MKRICTVASSLAFLISSAGMSVDAAEHPDRVEIPAGSFQMGCSRADNDCARDEGSPGGVSVVVPAFKIDRYEVTVTQFQACIDEGICSRPKDYARNKYCNIGAQGRDDHPVNCVDWPEAVTYCKWKSARLPYEAEWEKAARAKTYSRYPWGQAVTCKNSVLDDGVTAGSVPNEFDGCGEDRTWAIGSRPANAFGIFDMHGNVGEWTENWYARGAISDSYAVGKLKAPETGRRRVVRGGSWDENKLNLRSSFRNVKYPLSGESVYGSIGFRCAVDVEKE